MCLDGSERQTDTNSTDSGAARRRGEARTENLLRIDKQSLRGPRGTTSAASVETCAAETDAAVTDAAVTDAVSVRQAWSEKKKKTPPKEVRNYRRREGE